MDRRQSSRLPANLAAKLTVLSEQAEIPPSQVTIEEFSGNGARLWSPTPLTLGTLVKLELDDDLFLGEVRHCSPAAHGYQAGIHLDCALASLSGIRSLMRALFCLSDTPPSNRAQAADPHQQRDQQQRRQSQQERPA
jgi:hypothetical protein